MTEEELIIKAREMLASSYAPYSKFRVGAALLTESGEVFTGCNVENSAYGCTICAERVAIYNAISNGRYRFREMAVISDSETYTTLCGSCRQVLSEFCEKDFLILLCNHKGEYIKATLGELLPLQFSKEQM